MSAIVPEQLERGSIESVIGKVEEDLVGLRNRGHDRVESRSAAEQLRGKRRCESADGDTIRVRGLVLDSFGRPGLQIVSSRLAWTGRGPRKVPWEGQMCGLSTAYTGQNAAQ